MHEWYMDVYRNDAKNNPSIPHDGYYLWKDEDEEERKMLTLPLDVSDLVTAK